MDKNKVTLADFYKDTSNIFVISKDSYIKAQEMGVDIADYWKEVSQEMWMEHVKVYLENAYGKYVEDTKQKLEEVFDSSDWKYVYFHLACWGKRVEKGPVDPANLIAYYNLLKLYAEKTIAFYSKYYGEDVFANGFENLPPELQAAIKILAYVELEKQDKVQALKKLKECADIYPVFVEAVRNYIKLYPELEKQRVHQQKRDVLQLRNQVVTQMCDMLENGQEESALVICEQLKKMVPDDLEVVALGLEAKLMVLEK